MNNKTKNNNNEETKNNNKEEFNPFRPSGKLLRSPISEGLRPRVEEPSRINTAQSKAVNASVRGINRLDDPTTDSPTGSASPMGTHIENIPNNSDLAVEPVQQTPTLHEDSSIVIVENSPRLELIHKMRNMEEDAISQCRAIISNMQQAFRRQKNISTEVKDGVSKISELLDVTLNYRRSWKSAEKERTMLHRRVMTVTRKEADPSTPVTANPKRVATSPLAPESCKKLREKELKLKEPSKEIGGITERKEEWQTVKKKTNKENPKKKSSAQNKVALPRKQRTKPDAVIIRPAEGRSYAEVLKDLRSKIKTDDSIKMKSVRKTRNGAILLELERGEKVRPEFVQKLKESIRETASVAELRPRATIEIRDLDSLTLKDEVEVAIQGLLPNKEEDFQIRVTSPNTREQVRAFVTLSAEGAARLVETGHVTVGWIRARIRTCEDIKRCYRCLGTGHTQARCSGVDRRHMCIRCGKADHKMKNCTAALRCVHCSDAGRDQTDHLPGTKKCPLVKKW